MKAIRIGNRFEIYDDTLKTYEELPAQTYIVRFSKMSGFYLEVYSEIEIKEEKIYGVHLSKINKVLNVFNKTNRNLGVILSGDKGIGKSLFAKLLSVKAIEKGLPLIIVDSYIPGIASYLEQIEQEVLVLFDEFDKTFGNISVGDGETEPQASLLSLFDGLSQGKKLFVITCNEIRRLSDYLLNRPGRFHYHFRFEYPSAEEVKEYLEDKLNKEYNEEINKVVAFSRKVDLNYDCLRAIAFELNTGEPFEKAITDLNIINLSDEGYNVELHFEENVIMKSRNVYMDLFNRDAEQFVSLYDEKGVNVINIEFCPLNAMFDMSTGFNIIGAENIKLSYDEDEDKELIEKAKTLVPKYLVIKKKKDRNIHYSV